MPLPNLVKFWFLITLFLIYEYLVLHGVLPTSGLLESLVCQVFGHCGMDKTELLSKINYYFGWIGFSTMLLTNFYILRKRWYPMQKWGNLQNWLNWHIFFGVLGPTFIVFHCDFHVGGLVAISFWSMMVSAISGVVGRFFYMQIIQDKSEIRKTISDYQAHFERYAKKRKSVANSEIKSALSAAYAMAGGLTKSELEQSSFASFALRSMLGEIRIALSLPATSWNASKSTRLALRDWALMRKRLISLEYMKRLFGYWKSFHTPFAFFMYAVAIIHIVSSLIFQVD